MVIPACQSSGMSGTEFHFSQILSTYWGSFSSVSGGVSVVNSGAVIHDVFGCLFPNYTFSTVGAFCVVEQATAPTV